MDFFGHDWSFWAALFGAAIVRVLTSKFHSILWASGQIFVSVFMAWLLTDGVIEYLHINPMIYRVPMGGMIALTADGIVRLALNWVAHPSSPLAFLLRINKRTPDDPKEGAE